MEPTDNDTIPAVPVVVPIRVGGYLMHEGVVYKIISEECNGMVECQELGEEETMMLGWEEATEAFNAYLNN